MYFGQGITVWMLGLFATHPSIEERIERVRPGFQAEQYRHARVPAEFAALPIDSAFGAASGFAGTTRPAEVDGQRVSDTGNLWGRSATDSAKLVGTLDAGKVNFAARLIARLTPELRGAMRDAEGASAVLVATLLAPKKEVLADQADALRAGQLEKLADQAVALLPVVQKLGRGCDLMLIDLSLPAIKAGTDEDRRRLIAALEAVIHADRRVSLHEFVVLTLVKTQLATRLKPGAVKTRPLSALSAEIVLALSLVAHAGRKPGVDPANDAEVTVAFGLGAKVAGITDAQLVPKDKFSLDRAGEALKELMTLAPLAKAVLIKALFAVVTADGSIRLMEAELMRLLGAVLDCPLPPLIDDIDPESLAA